MSSTEQCILGAENKTRIDNIETIIVEIKGDIRKLVNDYSHRPTQTMLRIVAIMAGLLGTSVGVNIALIAILVKLIS